MVSHDETLALPSEEGAPIGSANVPGWLIAAGVGVALVLGGEALMGIAGGRGRD